MPSGSAPVRLGEAPVWPQASKVWLPRPCWCMVWKSPLCPLGNGLSPGFVQAASVWGIATPRGVIPLTNRSISEKPCHDKCLSCRSGKGDILEAPVLAGASCCLPLVDFRKSGASPLDSGQEIPPAGGGQRAGMTTGLPVLGQAGSPWAPQSPDPQPNPSRNRWAKGGEPGREGRLINSALRSCDQVPC